MKWLLPFFACLVISSCHPGKENILGKWVVYSHISEGENVLDQNHNIFQFNSDGLFHLKGAKIKENEFGTWDLHGGGKIRMQSNKKEEMEVFVFDYSIQNHELVLKGTINQKKVLIKLKREE